MRGHVRKRGSRWSVVVDAGRDESGKRVQKWHSGFERRKDAERALTEILGRLESGAYVEPSRVTLAKFLLDEWLPAMRSNLRDSTWASYRMNVRQHVEPHIGSMRLQALTAANLNKLEQASMGLSWPPTSSSESCDAKTTYRPSLPSSSRFTSSKAVCIPFAPLVTQGWGRPDDLALGSVPEEGLEPPTRGL